MENQNTPPYGYENERRTEQQNNGGQYNGQYGAPYGGMPVQPKTWLVESILATLFCCWPFAVVGIVNAARVSSLFRTGQYEEAARTSREARKWVMISFFTGIGVYIIYALLIAFGVLAKAFTGISNTI